MTDFFWEDLAQANDRLSGSYVPYNGAVVYIREVQEGRDGPVAAANIYPTKKHSFLPLNDKGFHRFRKTLPKGWTNCYSAKRALYLSRGAVRTTKHGMTTTNTKVGNISPPIFEMYWRDYDLGNVVQDEGYSQAVNNDFPDMREVLRIIKPEGVIALSNKLAISMDNEGLRRLHYHKDTVGVFTGVSSLLLTSKFSYLKEEILESPEVSFTSMTEF